MVCFCCFSKKILDNIDKEYKKPVYNDIKIVSNERIYLETANKNNENNENNKNNENNEKDYVVLKPAPKKRKKTIPSTVKRLVWNKYIGEEIGKAKCVCCNLTDITQLSFHCGHVIAESNGGEISVDNLRPICQNCNSSMRTQNLEEFKKILEIKK